MNAPKAVATPQTQAEFETHLKALHTHVEAVPVGSSTYYVRRPTQQEYDEFNSLAQDGGPSRTVAFRRYVSQCYVGSWPPGRTLEDAAEDGGPAVIGGPIGAAVNRLAGATSERPTRRL